MSLVLTPQTVTDALVWIDVHHSHHKKPKSGLFAVGVAEQIGGGRLRLCCVALASIPRARPFMQLGYVVEVTRVASDRTPHAASKAIAAISRAALALGYLRIVSSTLLGESGTSYLAAGWSPVHIGKAGREWDAPSRHREAADQNGAKVRWEFGPMAAPRDPEIAARVLAAVGTVEIRERGVTELDLFKNTEQP